LKIPCITLREETEWTETLQGGWNILAGTDERKIRSVILRPVKSRKRGDYYGDGRATKKIVAKLIRKINCPGQISKVFWQLNKMRGSPFFKSLFLTFITEGAVLASFFLFYGMIAGIFGPEGVGEYSLVKRSSSMILTLLLLGLGVGLPRYIAMASERGIKIAYFKAGAAIALLFAFIFLFAVQFI